MPPWPISACPRWCLLVSNVQSTSTRRPRVLSLVELAVPAADRLRRTADLTLRPWTESHELIDPYDLAAEIEEHGYDALFIEADFVLEETFSQRADVAVRRGLPR